MRFSALGGLLASFDPAAKQRPIFDGQPVCLDFPDHLTGAPELYFVERRNFAFHDSSNDHFSRSDIRFDVSVRPNRQASIRQVQLSIHLPVDEKILASSDLAFYFNSLANAGSGVRRDWYRLRYLADWGRI